MSSDVAVRPGESGPIPFIAEDVFAAVERAFPPERREQIARFLSIDADNPAMVPFLAISAAYQLNPMLGEIWLIPKNVRKQVNGVWETVDVKYSPSIGRDGLLSRARRDPSYLGHRFGVVCENDDFIVEESLEDFMAPPKIYHRMEGSRVKRGRVLGAWCCVRMNGRPYMYAYADIAEYGRTETRNNQKQWAGAWGYTSMMITKCAVSYAHRLALGITGVLPLDELRPEERAEYGRGGGEKPVGGAETGSEESSVSVLFSGIREAAGDDVADRLVDATREWPAARIEMTFGHRTPEALRVLADELAPRDVAVEEEDGDVKTPVPDEGDRLDEGEVETPPDDERIDERAGGDEAVLLRRRLDELEGLHAVAEPGSEASDEILGEMDALEGRLREIAGEDPNQEPLL